MAIAVVLIMVVVGWLVLRHTHTGSSGAAATTVAHHTTTTSPTATSSPAPTSSTTLVPVSSVKLQVLNGTGGGLVATHWTNKLKADPGYSTLPAADATATVASSEIYVMTPGYVPEAKALATTVGLPPTAVDETIPPPSTAPIPSRSTSTANLVFVVGPDLANKA